MFTQINKIDFLKILLGAGKESIILTFRPGQAHHTYDHIYFFDKNEKSFFSIYVVRKEQITPENIILGKEYFFNEKPINSMNTIKILELIWILFSIVFFQSSLIRIY